MGSEMCIRDRNTVVLEAMKDKKMIECFYELIGAMSSRAEERLTMKDVKEKITDL